METADASRDFGQALEACQRNDWDEAERLCDLILQREPHHADTRRLRMMMGSAHYNRALELQNLGRLDEAAEAYARAIAMRPELAEAYNNRGVVLREMGRLDEALQHYDQAIARNPSSAEAHNNRGVVLRELRRLPEALESYDRAISIRPGFAEAHSNRGSVLVDLGRPFEALQAQDQAVAHQPKFADAWVKRGVAQRDLGRHAESLGSLARAMQVDPDVDWLEGLWLHTKMRLYDWSDFSANVARLARRIEAGERAALPFTLIGLPGSSALQRTCAETWVRSRLQVPGPVAPLPERAHRERLRIGYFSANFHEHAVAYLIAELFELHDRSAFEVIAFSYGPDTRDAMRARIESGVDRFIDVRLRTDEDVVQLARNLEIDIAVDLMGFTEDARSRIFAMRAAPIQVSYLGYPGTMGADFIDYLIADGIVVPEGAEKDYAEKVIRLPDTYQVNDRRRAISDRVFSRKDEGLPETGFVFCCFSNNYKVTPETFDGWMRVLRRVDGSVLWILGDNDTAVRNLRREAESRGVAAERLVFAKRLPLADYIARYRLADLFLDTFPYNAHSTASDALWSGLPVLTRIGETFAGRVGASLLGAIGLPELVARTQEEYEDLAVSLATEPERLLGLNRRLQANRLSMPLFDAPRFTMNIEAAYREMFGEAPKKKGRL